jgi:hypothetical protein
MAPPFHHDFTFLDKLTYAKGVGNMILGRGFGICSRGLQEDRGVQEYSK